ncbi:MAG: protein tyrosine phosphatase family protein [Novosphingobium sp.]
MPDPDHIRAWQRINANLTTSGRLTEADVESLAAQGVRHVINLALADHPEALTNAEGRLAAHGMDYSHIPVPFDAPDDGHFTAFCKAMEGGDRPVHVHCIMNWRVSAFLYRYNRDILGMAEPQARALMERQWSPESIDHPAGPAWVRFIADCVN